MGKIRCFLRFFVLFAGVVFATNSFAAGYTCNDIKMYTSCNAGYYLNGTEVGNSCVACPENSSTTDENSAMACTCSTGHSVDGTTTGATTTTTTACTPVATTVNLDNANATTDGTSEIFGRYGTDVYLDSARTQVMTTTTNPISLPAKSYTVTYDANGGTVATTSQTATYTFNGYFTAATGGTQLVGATGYITDAGITQVKASTKDLSLYAQWTGVPVTMPIPERAGYIFNGWATSSTATSGSTGEYTPADNVKLYAIWGGSTYDCEAGTYWDADTAKCAQCTAGNYCKGVAGSNSGVDAGLTICPAGTSATGAKTENDCYFTITLNKNGGSGTCGGTSSTSDGSATCYYNKACTLPSWNASSCGLSNGAKIFKGWATSNDATSGSTALIFKATTTVYAVWETPTCSADNGTAKPANTTTNAPKCTVTCNNGYGTSGTYTGTVGSTSYNYACSANSITIKYDTNGATSGVPAASSQNCSYNGTCLATSQGTMLKTNSTFQGWASTNNATVAEYAPGASIKNIITSGEKTLYAVWSTCTACAEGTGATCVLSVVNNQCSYATNCATGYKDISNSGAYNPSCDPITYTIVYNANGGSGTTATSTHTYNKSDTLSTNGFTNGAKQFLGWAETSGASSAKYANKQSVSNLSSVDGDKVNLYAVWGAECTCDRGTGVASCTPSAPLGICGTATATASAGYNTATCGTSSNNVSKCSATPNKYTVTFNANTGSGTMSSQSFTYGVAQNLSENKFTKDGLKFQGWARSSDGNVEYSDKESVSNLTTNNNGSVSLYAIWGDAVSYTITYEIAGGATHSNATTYTVESPVTFTDASKAGYTFGGWFNDAAYNNRITKTSGTGNITVYGKLTPNEYTVTYNCNGGNTQTPYSNTRTVTFDDKFTTQPGAMCARTGYTFTGWNGKYPKANTEYTYTTVGNTTLTAQWTANKYTCDKGEYLPMLKTQCESCPEDSYCGGGEYTYSTSVNQGITGTCPTEYPDSELGADAKEDCYNLVTVTKGNIPTNCHSATWASCNYKDFYGITTETACVPTVTSVTAKAGAYVNGATLSCVVCGTGKYQSTNGSSATSCANSCTTGYTITGTTAADHDSSSDCYRVITLDKNGGDGSLAASVTCYQGADCNFGDASVLTQTGYTFTGGWGTSQSCTAKVSTFTTPSNSTYYACKTANQYTISFDANGGTGGQSADVLATYDSTMPAISATAPTKPGYVFTGWFDAKTGGTQYYTAVGQSAHTWDIAKATTLYAQWTVGGMNKVTFNENGGTTVSDTECNVMSGDITLPTITRAGHTFDGWYNDATGAKATSVAAGTCVSEMSFTAKWTKCADCTKGTGVSTCSVSVSNNTCVASAECATGYETPKCTGLSCVCTPKSYTVTYNCGDGTGTAPANATAIYNTGFAPATNTCTEPVGYDFSHWNDGTTIHTAGTDFLWTYTSGKTFTAEYVAEGAKTITYVTPDDTKWSGDYMLSCNADTDTFALPTADNIARAGYTFAGWKDATGAPVTSVTKGTCTSSLTFTAQWNACNSTEDGACGCASGTYPSNGVCSSCTTSCSVLGAEYQGTYNICVAGDAEQQCYKTCEISCIEPSSCPENFQKCKYDTANMISGFEFYGDTTCVVSDSACPIDINNSTNMCITGHYITTEEPDCSAMCKDLPPAGSYELASVPTILNGPNACYNTCAPSCDYSNAYILNTDGSIASETVNHCPEHATCTEGTIPTVGFRWYPQTVCTPTSFCSFTFVCDAGYVANTTSAVQYGYRKTLYGSPMTASDVASCTPGTYAVTLNDNNGVGGQGTVYQTYTVGWYDNAAGGASLESIVLPTRNGYTFMGYYDSMGTLVIGTDGLLPANNTYTADIMLVAQWKPNSYTVKYNLNGGYYADNSNPETYTIEDAFVLSNPTKRGYDFGGWFSDSGFNTSVTEISAGTIGNKEFWAKWTPVTYKITYNLNGGTYKTGESNPDEYTVETNTIVLKKPEKTGFTFSKWTDANGNTVTQIINGSIGDMVLTANWASDSYVITYDLDGGTNNAENPDAYTISDTPIALKNPVKTGYIFDGWTGDKVVNNEIIAGTTGHITVVANWTPTTFTVHFDPTDAGSLNVADVTCVYDMECAAADTIEMPNKTFSVWNTQKDGKGKTIVANGSIKNLLSDGGEITLYAIWDQNMVACEAGYYYNNGVRTRCELGKYCPGSGEINEGSTGCMETCPANGATTTAGADSISDCRKVTTDGGDMTFNFGTAKWDCWYTSGSGNSAIYTTNCDSIALTCDAGYYYSGVGNACTPVTDGYYSPAPVVENGTEDTESMAAHACPGETGAANDGIGSNAPRATEADCYSACSLTTSDIANSKTVTPDEANAPYNTASAEYAACSYTITCNAGYTAKNGTNPQCVANKYTVTLDKNQGTGDVSAYVECTFDSGACKLPATDGLARAGYVSANKWCTNANGSGACYAANVATSENISANGSDTKLYAIWEPDVFKIELVASDATENATQKPVYLKYTVGWFEDVAANKALTTIDTSALPGKSGYNFAGYSVGDVMIIDAAGTLQNTNAALRVTTNDTTANVVWSEGDTVCEAGYYYPGRGGDCVVCAADHWCPGGTYPTDTGVVGGHEICLDGGISAGGASATNSGVCYKQGLAYTSTTGKASGTQTCNYDENTKAYDASCRDHSVKKCVAGYYYVSGIDCVEVGINHYSGTDDLKRYECPENGLTGTLTTADDAAECYKTVEYNATYGAGTQVCNYTSDNADGSAKYATNCRDKYITTCQGGYYRENAVAIDCTAVGYDAYSEPGSLNRTPCPDGGDTNVDNAAESTSCFKAENPFTSDHGSGFQYCIYSPENKGYTECRARMFQKCDPGYYWNAIGDTDCTKVGYGFFGPVADAGNEGRPTARQGCATFDGRAGQTESDTSSDASACFMTEMPCSVAHGGGIKTCGYNTNAEDYSSDCTACMLDTCDEKYYINNNQCDICPAGSICDESTRTGFDGVANAEPQVCSALFDGRYPESDAGSTNVGQCFGDCDAPINVTTMVGRDYQGADMTDTCEIQVCDTKYYLTGDKSQCELCPENSVCDAMSGSDIDLDGTPDGVPMTCDELTGGTHKLSGTGSTKIEQCYTTCEDYEILGGMAIRDSDTVQYDNVCTFKGMSETGNPCEIQTIKGYETCVETSCNPDYELIDGRCQRCERANATAYKPNGNCLVAKCHTGFHPEGDQCADDVKTCTAPNAYAASQTWDNKLGAFGICKITECVDGYHVSSNACVPDVEVCSVEHGTGTREWDENRGTWGECIATSCEPGYTNDSYESDEPNKQCGRCRNAKSVLGQDAASSYIEGCTIAACMYQGELYNLENNECVPICPVDEEHKDETGTMKWNSTTKKCERNCNPGYMSW